MTGLFYWVAYSPTHMMMNIQKREQALCRDENGTPSTTSFDPASSAKIR
jgi:hypothetical protein